MRLACLSILLLVTLSATSQEQNKPLRKFVVADMETRVPVRNAIVMTTDGYRDTTNYRGICYIPETFDTLTVYKANYLTERLLHKETKDSTFLLPNHKRIGEVTVWGKDRAAQLEKDIEKWTKQGGELPDPSEPATTVGFNLANMLDARRRKDLKHLRKTRQTFKKMGKYDDDPIINAYKKEMERQRLAAERAKKAEELKAKLKEEDQQATEEKKRLTEETKEEIEN
jgi:hypothetical protein